MRYDPNEHLIKVRGNQDYLPVAQRLVWFREVHPDWSIETRPVVLDVEKGMAIFEATIRDATGRILARATKMENIQEFADFVEKAETGAVGRALAMCGFGTQFAPEFEATAPEPLEIPAVSEPAPIPSASPGVKEIPKASSEPLCASCHQPITPHPKYPVEQLVEMSTRKYGEPLCYNCALNRARKG